MKILSYIFFFMLFSLTSFAQEEDAWDAYLARYDKGPGSTVLNMSIWNRAPITTLPFLVVTGVTYKDCSQEGLPNTDAFAELYRISDSVQACVSHITIDSLVGTFTYQCERLDYFYAKDTMGVRAALEKMYRTRFPEYKSSITIKEDRTWSAYKEFLFPNEETQEYMQNEKVVSKLEEAGDNLRKARQVDHWIYFATEKDRDCFIGYARKNNFKIESKEKIDNSSQPFKLQMSRTDKIDMESISRLTLTLRKEARKCNGDYDGWETIVVK
jgi:hypothetical protein